MWHKGRPGLIEMLQAMNEKPQNTNDGPIAPTLHRS